MLLSVVSGARAQTVVHDFNDADGWTPYNPIGVGSFNIVDSAYRIQAAAPSDAEGGPGRAGIVLAGTMATDFTVSVDLVGWDAGLQQTFGIMARANDIGLGTSNGYLFSYSPRGSFGDIAIELFQNEGASFGTSIRLDEDLNASRDYRMVFTGAGDSFTGSIYELDNVTNPLVGTVNFTDATYSNGAFGLLVADSNPYSPAINPLGMADATFDNFQLTAIPEPSTYAALAGVGALGMAMWFRRRVRQAPTPRAE